MTEAFKDSDEMPFGKHKGEKIGDVPASYLLWFIEQDWAEDHPKLEAYVLKNRTHLEKDKRNEKWAK